MNRREFGAQLALATSTAVLVRGAQRARFEVVAFDAFPILDPRPVFFLAQKLFPEKGLALGDLWRTRQFEYCWLRTLSGRYVDFRRVTEDALIFAARALGLQLTAEKRAELMGGYLHLRCWPEVPEALHRLKAAGVRLAFLSNMTAEMLNGGIRNSGLEGVFEQVLSTDRVQMYKPHERAYAMGVDAFGIDKRKILFAAFAGWDVAGAKAFGYPTFWVNRQDSTPEQLGISADAAGKDLNALLEYVIG